MLQTGGNSSDSDTDAGTTVLNLKPRARRFLPEQFSQKAAQACRMEWKNEVDVDAARQPCPRAPHRREGATQTPGALRQPLLPHGQLGPGLEGPTTESQRPRPPPRLVRRASEPGGHKARWGGERP